MRRIPQSANMLTPGRRFALCAVLAAPLLIGCVSDTPSNTAAITREQQAADDPRAMVRIGDAARDQGDLKTATAFYGRAAALRPQDPAYVTPYAETLAASGELGRAMTVIRKARNGADAETDIRFLLLQGRLLTSSQRPMDAIALLNPAITQHPNNAALQIGLGIALDTAQDFTGAQTAYRRALQISPTNIPAQNNLALSTALSGNPTQALAVLTRLRGTAIEQAAPDQTLATIDGNLAIVYALLGDIPNARRVGIGAVENTTQLQANNRFYSLLAPGDNGAPERSGLSATPD